MKKFLLFSSLLACLYGAGQSCASAPTNTSFATARPIGSQPLTDSNSCHPPAAYLRSTYGVCWQTIENTVFYTTVSQSAGPVNFKLQDLKCTHPTIPAEDGIQWVVFAGSAHAPTLTTVCEEGFAASRNGSVNVQIPTTSYPAGTNLFFVLDGNAGSRCTYKISATNVRPLPVKLSHFTVRPVTTGNELSWQASEEINHSYYAVERSYDGTAFSQVAHVRATGDGLPYALLDRDLSPLSFYRLRMVSLSGDAEYSRVVKVSRSGTATVIPVKGGVQASGAVIVIDVLGRVVARGKGFISLTPGVYFINQQKILVL